MQNLIWLKDITAEQSDLVGARAVRLAELFKQKFPIPNGFVITSQAYEEFIVQIKDQIRQTLASVDIEDLASIQRASEHIQMLFFQARMSEDLRKEIIEAHKKIDSTYDQLGKRALELIKTGRDHPAVCVRPSARVPSKSILNIKSNGLFEAIKKCWASFFTPRAIYSQEKNKKPFNGAVIIQKMLNSVKSGTLFSTHPLKGNETKALLYAKWGVNINNLEQARFVINKADDVIIESKPADQIAYFIRDSLSSGVVRKDIPDEFKNIHLMSPREITVLNRLGKSMEAHFNFPQQVNWVVERKRLFIIDTKPAEFLIQKSAENIPNTVLKGLPIKEGVVKGRAKRVITQEDVNKIEKGDILVTHMTSDDIFPAIYNASAIITNSGHFNSHAIKICRELGKPCIIGTETATTLLQDGQEIEVDANQGVVIVQPPPAPIYAPVISQPVYNPTPSQTPLIPESTPTIEPPAISSQPPASDFQSWKPEAGEQTSQSSELQSLLTRIEQIEQSIREIKERISQP